MRKLAFALAGLLFMGITSCDNASSKIQNESNEETSDNATATTNGNSQQQVDANSVDGEASPQFSFEKENHDFGEIKEGTVAKHDFKFTNTGDAPLIITNAKGSCGCTVPEWPREPIAPGETGTIHVEFNSDGRTGNQTKQVTINANTVPNTKLLKISAQVTPKDGEKAEAAAQ